MKIPVVAMAAIVGGGTVVEGFVSIRSKIVSTPITTVGHHHPVPPSAGSGRQQQAKGMRMKSQATQVKADVRDLEEVPRRECNVGGGEKKQRAACCCGIFSTTAGQVLLVLLDMFRVRTKTTKN